MTDQELSEIERRASVASPGPWRPQSHRDSPPGRIEPLTQPVVRGPAPLGGSRRIAGVGCGNNASWRRGRPTPQREQEEADAAFIAAAREDVPALLAEVRRLRAELESR